MSENNAAFDEITVRRINVVDETGVVRLVIHNQQRTPPPPGRGFAGITFFDEDGRENGALLIMDTPGLKFDQHKGDEVVKLGNFDDGGKEVVRGLTICDRPKNEEEYTAKFEQEHGRDRMCGRLKNGGPLLVAVSTVKRRCLWATARVGNASG